jgi:hypothetical protein
MQAEGTDDMASAPASAPSPARSGRRVLGRIYLFEWVAMLSFLAVVAFAVTAPVGLAYGYLVGRTLRRMALVALSSVACILAAKAFAGMRSGAPFRSWLTRSELARAGFWTDLLRIIVAFSMVQTAHLTFKVYIPLINGSNYDELLRRCDRALFLGHDPIALVIAVCSAPLVLRAFDLIYSVGYFFLLWGGVALFFTQLDGARRTTFFSSFVVMWQLGLLFYLLLPSWGPVFTTPELFESALEHMPATVWVQSHLYQETASIIRGNYDIVIHFFGLAAFPSLHVGVFVLYSLWAARLRRIWLQLALCCLALIFIGSMLTGYHYLVDGIGGGLVSGFAYVVARRLSGHGHDNAAPPRA